MTTHVPHTQALLRAVYKRLRLTLRGLLVAGVMLAHQSIPVLVMLAIFAPATIAPGTYAYAQCPVQPPLQNFTGGGQVACPCFVAGEEAGVVLDAPAAHYPIEIIRIGVGWGSLGGGNPAQVEEAIRIYPGALPNPGSPLFELPGPQLIDGFVNEFDIEPLPGEVMVNSGPFTVTLRFLNPSTLFGPTVVHDGNGCQVGKNVVFETPGVWTDGCSLGITGNWVFYAIYRACTPTGIDDTPRIVSNAPALLTNASPNPFSANTQLEFFLAEQQRATLAVYDVAGRRVADLVDRDYPAGTHRVSWDGRSVSGEALPTGVYFVQLKAGDYQSVRKVVLAK